MAERYAIVKQDRPNFAFWAVSGLGLIKSQVGYSLLLLESINYEFTAASAIHRNEGASYNIPEFVIHVTLSC